MHLSKTTLPPAQLFLCESATQENIIIEYLQNIFCPNQHCTTCETCLLIQQKQHYGALWIKPEPRYTLDILESIFKRVEFSLEPGDHVFFVLEQVDFLTSACANSLLKLLEEPPTGYHFLLTAQNVQQVLITIRSRCTITQTHQTKPDIQKIPFLQHFITLHTTPQQFLKDLQNTQLQEITTHYYIDSLIEYWTHEVVQAKKTNNTQKATQALRLVALYQKALETPAMPGSAKLFWKNIYLQKEEIVKHV